jgi:hypothetical protein
LADALGSQRAELCALVPQGRALDADFETRELPAATTGYAMAAVPQGGDEPVVAARRYLEMTAELVQAAYRKWLRPDDLVQIIRGPRPNQHPRYSSE